MDILNKCVNRGRLIVPITKSIDSIWSFSRSMNYYAYYYRLLQCFT